MGNIIQLSSVRTAKDSATKVIQTERLHLSHAIAEQWQTPENVKRITSSRTDGILEISPEDIRVVAKDYLIRLCQKQKVGITPPIHCSIEYLSELIGNFHVPNEKTRAIIEDPYVTDWMSREDFQTAGDTACYGFFWFFRHKKNQMDQRDYLSFVFPTYSTWYGKSRKANAGLMLASGIPKILPLVGNIPNDLFRQKIQGV